MSWMKPDCFAHYYKSGWLGMYKSLSETLSEEVWGTFPLLFFISVPLLCFLVYSFFKWHPEVLFLFYCSCFLACSSLLPLSVSVSFTLSACAWINSRTQDGSRTKANESSWLEQRRGGGGVLCWLDFSAACWTQAGDGFSLFIAMLQVSACWNTLLMGLSEWISLLKY